MLVISQFKNCCYPVSLVYEMAKFRILKTVIVLVVLYRHEMYQGK